MPIGLLSLLVENSRKGTLTTHRYRSFPQRCLPRSAANKAAPVLVETELVDSDKNTFGPGRNGEAEHPHGNLEQPQTCVPLPTSRVSQQIRDDRVGLQDGSCLTCSVLISWENLSAGSC